jgi:CDP-diacylglycerol--serine O-phosphatidyltransferase
MLHLANIITTFSLACGFLSIIFSLGGHFTLAAWLVIASVVLDGLDGQLARKINFSSEFGKELDSLVDVVSFGIAPAVLGYLFIYKNFHFIAIIVLFINLTCSVMRLAKYNITPEEKMTKYFYGLPTTVGGGLLVAFILIHKQYAKLPQPTVFLALVLLLALLMISKIRYLNLDGLKQVLGKVGLIILAGVFLVFIFFPASTVFALFVIYLLFSPFVARKL